MNEAGKSNLLLALWKLNPAKGGEINFADDMPVTLFSELRAANTKPRFIQAVFEITSDKVLTSIATKAGFDKNVVKTVQISRDYDGARFIHFPDALAYTPLPQVDILNVLQDLINQISSLDEAGKLESGIKIEAEQKTAKALSIIANKTALSKADLIELSNCFKTISAKQMQTSTIRPIIADLCVYFSTLSKGFDQPNPSVNEEVRITVFSNMPKFVYYSNYGNLDSEIYLPHVIDNMSRDDLSGIAEAKARTLLADSEVEDIIPFELLQRPLDRLFSVDMDFSTVFDNKRPIIPQIEKFALDNALGLPVGYKVELARQFKQALITRSGTFDNRDCISIWQSIFDRF